MTEGEQLAGWQRKHAMACAIKDWHLVAEIEREMEKRGLTVVKGTDGGADTWQSTEAVVTKRKPGRPRKNPPKEGTENG